MKQTIHLTFISDPGHGWLKVPTKALKQWNIEHLISAYSYKQGEYSYLEEDCDAAELFNEAKKRDIEIKLNIVNVNDFDVEYSNQTLHLL